MRSPLPLLAALALFALAADARAGQVDFTIAPGSQVNLAGGSPPALSDATAAGVPNGAYSFSGADPNVPSSTNLSLTGILGSSTISGTYGHGTELGDGPGSFLLETDVMINPLAGDAAYGHGEPTRDVMTSGSVKASDLRSSSAMPRLASLALTGLGVAAAVGGHRLRRRKLATA